MKDTAGVGVELRQIYSSGRRSHHPNGAPRPAKPNPNYRAERPDPPSPPPPEQAGGEGTSTADGDWVEEGGRLPDRLAARSGNASSATNVDDIV
jgi:hypothetical protein